MPLVAVVDAPSTTELRMVLLEASFCSEMAGRTVSVLRKVRKRPEPLKRPSIVTRSAPFKRIIPKGTATPPEIVLIVALSG